MDMTASIAPKTDQINNVDFIKTGPITVTINRVTEGPAEQPFNFHMEETPGRAYRPSKSMRNMMVAAWGPNPEAYVGHGLTLYRNPATKFGREQTGGIEISHMSHIDKPITRPLTVSRGKRANFTIKPLATPTPRDFLAEATAATTSAAVNAIGHAAKSAGATAETLASIRAIFAGMSEPVVVADENEELI
ncbi:hypothetical protein E3T46_07805 [Cryobacterium sp. Hh11]|uniref:hypothetical protein n=1 Tax=Cryobacterium sp. Hh11 TaxID=2555868 RepID=UPI00106DAB9B|nr:hypothetical protein [Cryobacterium sp. Hh11]TFD51984.1 hypothetical protein E3T46_07805 [Cryobacterium sp. Hh11]